MNEIEKQIWEGTLNLSIDERLCRNEQHVILFKETKLLCRILGHKLNWHNHIVHRDIIHPKLYEVMPQTERYTDELLQMCTRCKLYFNSCESNKKFLGVVDIK